MEPNCPALTLYMQLFYMLNLIKTNTYFKGKSSYIELINTNIKYFFKYSFTFEASLSDHHQLLYSTSKKTKNENILFIVIAKNSMI